MDKYMNLLDGIGNKYGTLCESQLINSNHNRNHNK